MPTRRMKAYTAQTGYVYEYYFVGKRGALAGDAEAPATEYIFDVTSDRKTMIAVSVFLKPEALAAWASSRGRTLSEAEQYAAAKMRLFRGFDELEKIQTHTRLRVDAGNIQSLLEDIGVE